MQDMTGPAIAVIPARGGSKRIPRKNVRPFAGKPMIAWPLGVALRSGLFSHVLVSTDDEEIAQVARDCGAEVPFTRPSELADDHTGTGDVMAHATEWARQQGWEMSAVCCIYATAAFIQEADLARGRQVLASGPWSYAIAATTFAAPVSRAFHQRADGGLEMFFPEHVRTRSQDLPVALHDAAQFYWGRPAAWLERRPGLGADSTAVLIPRWRVQDIDDEDDWRRAELLAPLLRRGAGA
jgi:N-acylneuraminate cytidylyltransferase